MKKPLYNLFPGKIFRSSQTNRSGAGTDSKAESNSIRTGERDKDGDTSIKAVVANADAGFLWLPVSLDSVDLEKTLAKDFGGRDQLSKKRWLHLLREKVRRQNHERDSERIGALVFLLDSTK